MPTIDRRRIDEDYNKVVGDKKDEFEAELSAQLAVKLKVQLDQIKNLTVSPGQWHTAQFTAYCPIPVLGFGLQTVIVEVFSGSTRQIYFCIYKDIYMYVYIYSICR